MPAVFDYEMGITGMSLLITPTPKGALIYLRNIIPL